MAKIVFKDLTEFSNTPLKIYDGGGKLIGDAFIVTDFGLVNRERRLVTVVGLRYKIKIPTCCGKIQHTILKLGYAIKHPDDKADYRVGIKEAIKKAINSHKALIATSYSLLTNDRCMVLVRDEVNFITNNLEKYI